MARKAKELIKAATIATALDKVTGNILGWAVKSNSSNKYYQVTTMIIDGVREFFCNCDARQWGCSECAHIQAVKEVLVAKSEIAQQEAEEALQQLASFEAVKAEIETIEAGWSKEEAEKAVAEAEKLVAQIKKSRQEWQNSVWNNPNVATSNKAPAIIKRAPQFENMPLNGNRGFSLLKVS